MTQQIERRALRVDAEVRADGGNKIGGYAAVFNSPSVDMGFTETIDPKAFDSVMASNPDVRCLFNHDDASLLGRTSSGTLRLHVDARGLSYECDLPDTQLAHDVRELVQRRDISGSSFGFVVKRDQWTDQRDGTVARRILEFDSLLDVSPVTFPAYDGASVVARSLPASMPAEFRSRFEKRDANLDADLANSTAEDIDSDTAEDGTNDNGCGCQCAACIANLCEQCMNPLCDDPKCLSNIRAKLRASKAETRQQVAEGRCECACVQCRDENCAECSNSDCDDARCLCNMRARLQRLVAHALLAR